MKVAKTAKWVLLKLSDQHVHSVFFAGFSPAVLCGKKILKSQTAEKYKSVAQSNAEKWPMLHSRAH
jgi:hypothetical protein